MEQPATLLTLLDEIRSIAQLGLNFAEDPYDRERYERLLRLAAVQYSTLTGLSEEAVAGQFRAELGYITPKVGCAGAVFNDEGHVLLVKRSDNGRYCLPGGYAEVNHTPEENLRRELHEETGLDVEVGRLYFVTTILPGEYGQPHTLYSLTFECRVVGGALTPSHETPEVGYYDPATVTDWHFNHQQRVEHAYQLWRASQDGQGKTDA